MERPRRSEYTPNDLLAFREAGTLDITPKFQRRNVWRLPQRSYFLDSLLRDMPVPPLYFRETQSEGFTHVVRQVVDGQQRVRTILDFLDGKFSISRSLDSPWAGKPLSRLARDDQQRLKNYHFPVEVFVGVSDADVLDIFARLNTYSVRLNAQELRNGKFFGQFKQQCYGLAHEHLEFWRTHRLFTEQAIARMLEVELTSELVILTIDGPQDKKNSIDRFYSEFDDSFPERESVARRFRAVIDEIGETMGDSLKETAFRRVPLFYSLFGAVYHDRWGLPRFDFPSRGSRMKSPEREGFRQAVLKLSNLVEAAAANEEVPSRHQRFVAACLRQTDNIQPRRTRIETILREAAS